MIIQLLLIPLFGLLTLILELMPTFTTPVVGFNTIIDIAGYGTRILGTNFCLLVIGNIVMWLTIQMGWSIIEWVYKKLPGVE